MDTQVVRGKGTQGQTLGQPDNLLGEKVETPRSRSRCWWELWNLPGVYAGRAVFSLPLTFPVF